jgi:hypothetical protein
MEDKGMGEWHWGEFGSRSLRFAAIFGRASEQFVVGSEVIAVQDLLANPVFLGQQMQRRRQITSQP